MMTPVQINSIKDFKRETRRVLIRNIVIAFIITVGVMSYNYYKHGEAFITNNQGNTCE